MKRAKLQVIIGFFLAVSTIATYKVITTELVDPDLKEARIAYETEKIQLEQEQLKRYDALEAEQFRVKRANLRRENDLNFYGAAGLLSICGLALIILAIGYSRAKVKRASVHTVRIGQHSEIPVHQKDLQSFYPIAVNLSLAEIEASVSTAHENAYRISRQMIADIADYTRAFVGKRGMLALGPSHPAGLGHLDASAITVIPTFAELLNTGVIAPGKPLILGYDRQGQPQSRSLHDLKSLAIAGWQGSGKTLSTAYILASSVLAYGVRAYVVDPHKHHHESLYSLIKPLENTGHVTIINPFDTPALMNELDTILNRRLAGQEPGSPGILLVIDEMARLAKMECFDVLVAFLERCTEETRKANITFIGGSHKWTARHFKGRADIRGCMNSMLIHKTKPSQADLLLEDSHDKNLVKQLHRPGDAILVTDYDTPTLVSIPLCKREDMQAVADMVRKTHQAASSKELPITLIGREEQPELLPKDMEARQQQRVLNDPSEKQGKSPNSPTAKTAKSEKRQKLSDVIPFEFHLKKYKATRQATFDPSQLTVEMIQKQFQKRKMQDANFTQAAIARQAGMSQSYLSKILNDQCPLSDNNKQKLYNVLFASEQINTTIRKS
jgi:hypothetical protein